MMKQDMNAHDLAHIKRKIGGDGFAHHSIRIPGSKSDSNRAIIASAMSTHPTILSGFLFADDTFWGLKALKKLGFEITSDVQSRTAHIDPKPILQNQIQTSDETDFFLGKAGTLARFFPAVLLNLKKTFPNYPSIKFRLNAEPQLQKRPISDLCHALQGLHAQITPGSWPIEIFPSDLKGHTEISGRKSGQFLSGLLFAAAGAKEKITILRTENLVQPDYVRMTLKTLGKFHCAVDHDVDLTQFRMHHTSDFRCSHYEIEPDASTACYFIALAFLHNFDLTIQGLGSDSIQPDLLFIDFLKRMGACIKISATEIRVMKRNSQKISGGFCADFSLCSDQALTAAVVALFADNPIEIKGIGHIRNHECDRISCLISNLTSFEIQAQEKPDGFVVFPWKNDGKFSGKTWKTFDDHRFAMSGFLFASMFEQVQIENPSCVGKTAPEFFDLTKQLGFELVKRI